MVEADAPLHPRLDGPDVPMLMRLLFARKTIGFRYITKQGHEVTKVLSPHRLIHSAGVYHLRGFDHGDRRFKDFSLARIYDARPAIEPFQAAEQDRDWIAETTLTFWPAPAVSADHLEALRRTYPLLSDGRMEIKTTKARAYYVRRSVLARVLRTEDGQDLQAFDTAPPSTAR